MSNENIERILNCVPSRKTEKDWALNNAMEAGVLAAPQSLPASRDLREPWWQVGDQGDTGSCVGWATADGLLRWHFVKAGWLSENERLSTRFIWMAAKETDEYVSQPTTFIDTYGTSLKAALDIALKYGCVRDNILPFASEKLYKGGVETFYAMAAQLKIASYFNLGTDVANWKKWLATNGPILTRLEVDDTWNRAPVTGGRLDEYHPSTATEGGHSVALVGYTSDRFIVRNSYGATWGDKGFGYASLHYAQAAFTEAYGITV